MFNIKYVGVDFDSTLCMNEENFPICGKPSKGFEVLKKFRTYGGKVILWTCREGKALQMAVDYCASQGLILDAVNEPMPEQVQFAIAKGLECSSRKIFCDMYIDDKDPRALMEGIDWELIRSMILDLNVATSAA
jgi:hypothetical protein